MYLAGLYREPVGPLFGSLSVMPIKDGSKKQSLMRGSKKLQNSGYPLVNKHIAIENGHL